MTSEKKYSSKEIAEILGVSDRTVRRYLNSYISQEGQSYQVSQEMLDILKAKYLDDEEEAADIIVQEFTNNEYSEFHRRLTEYPLLKNDLEHHKKHAEDHEDHIKTLRNELEYHKRSAESHNRQMEIILNTLQQRNFIEAKEKGLDEENS